MNNQIIDQPDSDNRPTFAAKAYKKLKSFGYFFIIFMAFSILSNYVSLFYMDLMAIPMLLLLIGMLRLCVLGIQNCSKSYRQRERANYLRGLTLGIFSLSILGFALILFSVIVDIFRTF